MRIVSGLVVLSPSDLMRFQGCAHSTSLDLRLLRGEPLVPAADAPDALVLQARGEEHEARYLDDLRVERDVVVIERTRDFAVAAAETVAAMAAGAPAIYQGALATGRWQGWSDFLERVDEPSAFGPWSYEAVDTKLKRRVDPKHAVQLSIYSRAIEEAQGRAPARMHVHLGDGTRATIVFGRVRHYVDRLARRCEAFVDSPHATLPDPVAHCDLCRWREACRAVWEAGDSLVRVAGITRAQRRRLEAVGVDTRAALAASTEAVARFDPAVLERLRMQASLQAERAAGGAPRFVLREEEVGRGFDRLPAPAPGDIFFDMEGDPHVEGGLEYLLGIVVEEDGRWVFKAWWAHDASEEAEAVVAVLDFMVTHLRAHPGAHVYHYNHYEPTALKRLTGRCGLGEGALDHLLRTKAFVDLYRIVRQAVIVSEDGYSIKDLEAFYMPPREGDVSTAAGSVVAYERWLATGDGAILGSIASYNEDDCRSTRLLRDWLVAEVRPLGSSWPVLHEDDGRERPIEDPILAELRGRVDVARPRLGDRVADLALALVGFHQRAQRPQWWEYFDRPLRDLDELMDDMETLVGLRALGPAVGVERDYAYPTQETKLRKGSKAEVLGERGTVALVGLDRSALRARVKFPKKLSPPPAIHVVPGQPVPDKVLREAVRHVIGSIVAGGGRYGAIGDFLARRRPRLRGHVDGEPIVVGGDVVAGAVDAVRRLDAGCLPMQGPPGTGKTYVASCAVLDLALAGRRVAVSSNSHKAIDNLLVAVADRARERGCTITIVKKVGEDDGALVDPMIGIVDDYKDGRLVEAMVVGGTAWLFAREEFDSSFDTLIVDEAGQVSIANVVASARSARNLVLVGDQMQLAQPVQGVHPGESGLSCLEYLLDGAMTVAPANGVFLSVSRRMHPDVCAVVSELFYEGRLTSDDGAARHRVVHRNGGVDLPATGVVLMEVPHVAANSQTSAEEAKRVAAVFEGLLGATFTDREGRRRMIGVADVMVVSPYNAQVNLLTEVLPVGARVGTVDKFQGQEAPICLVSMATEGGEQIPRGIKFLFSANRLNVAVSRAQALAVVFCSARLLEVSCQNVDDCILVDAFCSLTGSFAEGSLVAG